MNVYVQMTTTPSDAVMATCDVIMMVGCALLAHLF